MHDFINKPLVLNSEPKFRVVSLFSGCGGSSLGYIWSGGKVLAAVEWDENAVQTYHLNFPHTPILHRDIATVTTEELLSLIGLKPGELDILDGSPPCQGFSTAGKRQFDDPRNSLFKEYIRLLRGLQPKVFVMENVSGMVKGNMKHVFAIIIRELKNSGYQVKCQLMNAMYFGVPQSRERVIFIGVRNDLGIESSHPKPQTSIIPLREIIPDAIACKSQGINPWISANRPSCILAKSWSFMQIKTKSSIRNFTVEESARIASFPDAFRWIDAKSGRERIGNSVPPLFMQAISEHIYTYILNKVTRQEVVHG